MIGEGRERGGEDRKVRDRHVLERERGERGRSVSQRGGLIGRWVREERKWGKRQTNRE